MSPAPMPLETESVSLQRQSPIFNPHQPRERLNRHLSYGDAIIGGPESFPDKVAAVQCRGG